MRRKYVWFFLYHVHCSCTIFFFFVLEKEGCLFSLALQILYVLFPFQGKHTLFLIIAAFTAGNKIILSTAAATAQWEQVIHGQLFKGHFSAAEMTLARSGPLLPPSALSQVPGLGPFPPNL